MCQIGDFQVSSSPVSCSGEMEYWTEAAVHATLRCVLACFVLCLFSLSPFVVALFVTFFYVALVAASCFFVAALTALSCGAFRMLRI